MFYNFNYFTDCSITILKGLTGFMLIKYINLFILEKYYESIVNFIIYYRGVPFHDFKNICYCKKLIIIII